MNNNFSKIYPNKEIKKISDKLNMLGIVKKREKYSKDKLIKKIQVDVENDRLRLRKDPVYYLNIRLFTTLIVFIITLFISKNGYIYAPIVMVIYYYLFYYLTIQRPIKKRCQKLDREALQFFEILTLTLESSRNLEHALTIAVNNVDSELSDEFKKTLYEIKFGKSLTEAMEDTKKRIPSETINNIILNITQTNVFGNSILETMTNQVDFLRDKQVLAIKEQINKIPNKISIISVIFIVPLILLLVLGPFLINYLS